MKLRPSRMAMVFLFVTHGLAVVALVACGLSLSIMSCLLAAVVASAWTKLHHHVWRRSRGAVAAISLVAADQIELEYRDGHRVVTNVGTSSTVLHWLMVLQLRHEKRRLTLFLLPDMLDRESWRRLAVRLRMLSAA